MKMILLAFFSLLIILTPYAQNPGQETDSTGNVWRGANLKSNEPANFHDAANPWIPVGPFGGDVVSLTIDPQNTDHLYAAAGLPFVSIDGGQNWTILTALSGISSGNVNGFAALTDGTIFATGPYTFGKVFRSTNGGTAWHTRIIPVNSSGFCLEPDPNDSNTIYIGLASNVSSTANKVIVRSIDAGGTWTAIDMTNVLPIGWSVMDISVDPDDSQTIFAVGNSGLSDAKIVASFDGGATWEVRTANLPSGIPYNAVAIAGQQVFVAGGQLFGSQYMGVYRSDDYGISWTNISNTFPNKVSNDILIDNTDADRMYVATEGDGIYYSTDAGNTWHFDGSGAGESGAARCLAMKPGEPDQLYAGFLSLALCSSEDAGLTWEFANTGIATLQVDDIEVNPLDPQMVLAGFEAENSGGCYMSFDGGDTWEQATALPGTRFSQVTFGEDGTMYAWSNGPSSIAQEGLYKSTDGGITWLNMGPNIGSLFETQIFSLAASATDPGLIFIGGNNFGVNGWAPVIYRSDNAGQTWVNTYLGSPTDYYSIRFLFIDPNSNDEIIYAAYKSEVQGGFLKSTDGGFTWDEIGTTIPVAYKWGGVIVCSPDNAEKILAGCGGYGNNGTVCISSNGGTSWTTTSLNLATYSKISDILIHPDFPDVVYLASTQDAVKLSTDGGNTWTQASDGLGATNITGFSNPFQHGQGMECFASTYTSSAFKTTLYDPSVGTPDLLWDFDIRIIPNPVRSAFRIAGIDLKGIRQLELLDGFGKPVQRFGVGSISTSEFRIREEIPGGFYLLRIHIGESVITAKLVVL